jgi:pimeloyl-ACP methyl ester carboxylesterase
LLVTVPALALAAGAAAFFPLRARSAPGAFSAEPAPASVSAPAFSVHEADWTDAARDRSVPVRLYWPQTVDSAGTPLVVFSHGIGGSRRGYSYLGTHFARNGVASLHVQHVGSDRALWTGNPFSLIGRLQDAAQEGEALHRAHDLRFALDQLMESNFGEQVNHERVIAAGHSYGANTVLLATGARVARNGTTLELRDRRLAAAIVISAPPFYGAPDTGAILRGIEVPSLHVTATEDAIHVPGYYSPPSDRISVFEATGSARKTLVVYEGGSHSMFTDRAGTGGVQLNAQVKAATQELSLAFFTNTFEKRNEGLKNWNERHRAIVARFESTA